jgi:uncharacterized membrane protein
MRVRAMVLRLVAVVVVLFVAAGATSEKHTGAGVLSKALFALVLTCLLVLFVSGLRALIARHRAAR